MCKKLTRLRFFLRGSASSVSFFALLKRDYGHTRMGQEPNFLLRLVRPQKIIVCSQRCQCFDLHQHCIFYDTRFQIRVLTEAILHPDQQESSVDKYLVHEQNVKCYSKCCTVNIKYKNKT